MQQSEQVQLIAVADGDPEVRRVMATALTADGYDVGEYERGDALLDALAHTRRPALIVADVCLPAENGLRVLRGLRQVGSGVPIVLITDFATEQTLNDAFRLGASVVLSKPFAVEDLRRLVACFLMPRSSTR